MPSILAETATTGVATKVVEALISVGTDMQTVVTSVLPVALAVVGAVMVVNLGVTVFKKITGKA